MYGALFGTAHVTGVAQLGEGLVGTDSITGDQRFDRLVGGTGAALGLSSSIGMGMMNVGMLIGLKPTIPTGCSWTARSGRAALGLDGGGCFVAGTLVDVAHLPTPVVHLVAEFSGVDVHHQLTSDAWGKLHNPKLAGFAYWKSLGR